MAEYTFRIPNWYPATVNQLMGGHWEVGAKRKKADRNLISCYTRHLPKATTRRKVQLVIELAKGKRGADGDAYFKSLLDALTHAGMLVDDCDKWCEIAHPIYVRSCDNSFSTTIKLKDI